MMGVMVTVEMWRSDTPGSQGICGRCAHWRRDIGNPRSTAYTQYICSPFGGLASNTHTKTHWSTDYLSGTCQHNSGFKRTAPKWLGLRVVGTGYPVMGDRPIHILIYLCVLFNKDRVLL